jgi:plastocyanin
VVALLAGLLMALPSIGNSATRSVSVRDNSFSPRTMTIRRNDVVRWRWAGRNPHDVAGRGFKSRVQRSGSYSRRFRSRGRFTIRCNLHSRMRQTITVR